MAILDSRSGKDQFVHFCQEHMTWCKNISTVDFVKQAANFCGWDGTKTPENRAFLSDLKDLLTKWQDVPFRKVEKAINDYVSEAQTYDFSSDDVLCFVHCREPQEIQKFVDKLGAKTLLIRRPAVEALAQSNHADTNVLEYNYDYIIRNDGSLEELEQKAIAFIKELGYKNLRNK